MNWYRKFLASDPSVKAENVWVKDEKESQHRLEQNTIVDGVGAQSEKDS